MSDIFIIRFATIAIAALAIWRLNARFITRRYLTFSAGMHLNVLLALAIGPFIYTFSFISLETERVEKDIILSSSIKSLICFLFAYLAVCLFESRKKVERAMFARRPFNHNEMLPFQLFLLIALVFTGIMGARLGLATRGVGTLFIIFYLLFYPMIILSVMKVSPKQAISMLFCIGLLAVTFLLVFLSPWRSQLVLWVLSVLIGIIYRLRLKRRHIALAGAAFALFIFIASPFLQYKKLRGTDSDFNAVSALIQSQKISLDERMEQSFGFLSARVNAVREFGFVNHAIDNSLTDYRRGATYKEMVIQLIPRLVWPNKPSFNYTSGFVIAREILLLGREDESTSAALTLWPEATINFGPIFLFIFVPMAFTFATFVDIYSRRLIRASAGNWLLDCTLFFLAFNLVSIVQFSTLFLWTTVVIFLYSKFFLTIYGNFPMPTMRGNFNALQSRVSTRRPARPLTKNHKGTTDQVNSPNS